MQSCRTANFTADDGEQVVRATSTPPRTLDGLRSSGGLDPQTTFEFPSSQESNVDPPIVIAASSPTVQARRRRRPNRRVRPPGVDLSLPTQWAPHHTVHA
jgi:hypothetical protein